MTGTGKEIADILEDSAKQIGPALAKDFSGAYKNVLHDTSSGLKSNAKRVTEHEATTAKNLTDIKPNDDVHSLHGGSSSSAKTPENAGQSAEQDALRSKLSSILEPEENEHLEDPAAQDFKGRHEFGASEADREKFANNYSKYNDDRDHIQEMKDYDEIAPKYAKIPNADLVAIRGYTGGEFYVEMNKAMREGDPKALAQYDGHINTLTSGLKQLDPYKGKVTRGIGVGSESMPAFLDRYKPGNDVTESHFVSSGAGNDFMGNVKFTIDSESGRSVKFLSHNPKESEVLFLPNSTFHVVSQEPMGPHGYHIHMKQTG
jgi:hypothetical protein